MNAILIMASIVHCYVGCNTGSPDKQALHVLECDTETGAAKIVQSVKGVEGTTYFQIDKDGKFLYSVIGEKRDTKSKSVAVRFPIDGWKLGTMERLCELPCEAPCHVSLTPDEKRIAFAAYGSATCGTVGIDGKGLKTFTFPDDALHRTDLPAVQRKANRRGKVLSVPLLANDRIEAFALLVDLEVGRPLDALHGLDDLRRPRLRVALEDVERLAVRRARIAADVAMDD